MAKRAGNGKLEDEISRLYALPPAEFTAERNALATRLRGDGHREAAAEVKALKKPNLPAWAINQGVRADPAAAEELVEAGERLSDAQTAALEGKGADRLRDAMADQQAAVEEMMRAVGDELGRGDRSQTILDRARETLRAIAGDEELRAQFRAGRLTRHSEAVGFGGAPVAPARPRKAAAKKRPPTSAARRREAERAERAAQRSLDTAVKRVSEARRRLERAQEAVEAAREAHEEAEREQAQRESALADARSVVQELRE